MNGRTIEDVLADEVWGIVVGGGAEVTVHQTSEQRVAALHTATADGPVFSEDGSIVAHRTDPELAERLLEMCSRMWPPPLCGDPDCPACTAAALLVAPAPATEVES